MFTQSVHNHAKSGKRSVPDAHTATYSSLDPHLDIDDSLPPGTSTGPSQTKSPHFSSCSLGCFKKYAKICPFGVINYMLNSASLSSTSVYSTSAPSLDLPPDLPTPPEPDPPDKSDFVKFVPKKYSDFEDVFNMANDP